MNTHISLHLRSDTILGVSGNSDNCEPYRALDIDSEVTVFFVKPEAARRMAVLLNQIARELEEQDNAS